MSKHSHKVIAIISLIIAGEIIFALPFHLARFFRPTLLEVFQLTATQLGAAQGLYGIVALLAYFPGGLLADRFATYKLLASSLWMTGLGGLYMASYPNYSESLILFGFYGITTIMMFWAALIRTTREWGGLHQQGTAFGLLEGGRGMLAVSLASLGILLFDWSFPHGYDSATLIEKQDVFSIVIYSYTSITILTGILVWFSLKQLSHASVNSSGHNNNKLSLDKLKKVMRIPAVWWQAIIVLCAYVSYKGVDHLSLYAVDAYHYDAIQAAKLVTLASWIRPITAVLAGIIADRTNGIIMILICFLTLLACYLHFALSTPRLNVTWILTVNVMITCTAVFSLRALYFSIFEHYKLPRQHTGKAVGIVSVVGFLPDVFVLYVAGTLTDNNPGVLGHQYFFIFLALFAMLGIVSTLRINRYRVDDSISSLNHNS